MKGFNPFNIKRFMRSIKNIAYHEKSKKWHQEKQKVLRTCCEQVPLVSKIYKPQKAFIFMGFKPLHKGNKSTEKPCGGWYRNTNKTINLISQMRLNIEASKPKSTTNHIHKTNSPSNSPKTAERVLIHENSWSYTKRN